MARPAELTEVNVGFDENNFQLNSDVANDIIFELFVAIGSQVYSVNMCTLFPNLLREN